MKLILKDIFDLEKLDLREIEELLFLLEILAVNKELKYEINTYAIYSGIGSEILKRNWLYEIRINDCPIKINKRNNILEGWVRRNGWRHKHECDESFFDDILPDYQRFSEKNLDLYVFNKIDFFYCLAFSQASIPDEIIDYLGIRYSPQLNYRHTLSMVVQTIGHILFSIDNHQLKWNQSAVLNTPIFSYFLHADIKERINGDNKRFLKDALREIVPMECRKRGNRSLTKFSEEELNLAPLSIPHIIHENPKEDLRISFYLLGIVLNTAVLTKRILSKSQRISKKEVLSLPILKQFIEKMNEQEKAMLSHGIFQRLKNYYNLKI